MLNAILLFVFFVSAAAMNEHDRETSAAKPMACHFFSYENAEKLLGQKVTASDGEESKVDGGQKWTCTFTTPAGENGPRLFFAVFRDASEETAKSEFQKIRLSNQKHAGFEEWPGVADEAVMHTDGKNFQFVMVRKGAKTLRIKVGNSGGVSFDELKSVAASLAVKLK